MTTLDLDREKIRELFDLRRRAAAGPGRFSIYEDDPYPQFHELRERGPVVEGIPHELIGFDGIRLLPRRPRPEPHHFSIFSYAECDVVYRNEDVFRSAPLDSDFQGSSIAASMLYMNGAPAPALPRAGAAVVRAGQGAVVDEELDRADRARADRPVRRRQAGRAQRRLRRRHPGAHDHRQLRRRRRAGTASSRESLSSDMPTALARGLPRADHRGRGAKCPATTSSACSSKRRYTDDDGVTHRLTDAEITVVLASLLLAAGSGTTWKQMGITLVAMLRAPGVLAAVRADRAAAARDRGVPAVDTDRPDVLAPRCGGHRPRRRGHPEGSVVHLVPRRRQPRPGAVGAARRATTSPGRRSRAGVRRTGPTSASACTWPAPR